MKETKVKIVLAITSSFIFGLVNFSAMVHYQHIVNTEGPKNIAQETTNFTDANIGVPKTLSDKNCDNEIYLKRCPTASSPNIQHP
ncbi:MAG: hypothetical protein GWN61_25150 [candidate division Zixibacteria bacterium]|nr:hypothetical protein [candidate division Zixibacteria bacterium]NIV09369.1 hypothetical protein [candidate division Zixibacteria bacterium]NIX59645.1 hypothetical protein [candidate division Zixibacteria bacterium]